MSSWYSNLVTKTSSQISNLRSTLLSSEADGDTEDDTHVCRVLRNYYTEKGRSFPNWLPPDPRAPPPQMTQAVYAQPQVGSRYGGLGGSQQAGGGGLSSLWDNGPAQQQQQPQVPQSLRAGRPATTQPGGSSRDEILRAQAPRSGSYSGPGNPAPAGSAQDRLKQRLWGTRTTSPSSTGSGPFQPPPNGGSASGGGGGGGGHQSQGSYEDRFAPGGSYDNARGGGGGGGGGGNYQPFVGANAPWSSDGGPYSGGGGGGGGRPANGVQRKGLPSGPRGYR